MNEQKSTARRGARIGRTLQEFREELEGQNPEYAAAAERLGASVAIANAVTANRARLAMTQDQLAALLGTTKSAVSRLESGRHLPNIDTVQRLADVLNVAFVIQPAQGTAARPTAFGEVLLGGDLVDLHELDGPRGGRRLANR